MGKGSEKEERTADRADDADGEEAWICDGQDCSSCEVFLSGFKWIIRILRELGVDKSGFIRVEGDAAVRRLGVTRIGRREERDTTETLFESGL